MRRNYRAPLIVFTPKSLLRAPQAVSTPLELASGRFERLLDDTQTNAAPDAVRRVLYCSGKVYYDLLEAREKRAAENGGVRDVAILRVEQLYPWPDDRVTRQAERYARAERIVWVQEEPANMGGFTFVRERLQDALRPHQQLAYAGRPESASTAVGSLRLHRQQQAALVAAAFAGL
jgi:2-oxoglutarate dehydrogenase E1 component